MRIPTENLSNGFISEILNLFGVKSKDINNQIVLVEESFLYNIFYNQESKSLEFSSFISVKKLPETQKDILNLVYLCSYYNFSRIAYKYFFCN